MATKKATVWEIVEAVLPISKRVGLYGPPGTGKSFIGSKYGLKGGQKTFVITVTPEMSMSEIRGHYMLKDGQMIWVDGIGIMAWREGARLVINEINDSSGDVTTFLHALLDDPEIAGITLPTGEWVKPKEGFQVVATMNGRPEDLEEALRDRFPVFIEILKPNPAAIDALPEDLRDVATKTSFDTQERRITLRAWAEYANLRGKIGEEMAATAVFGERATDVLNSLKIAKNKQ